VLRGVKLPSFTLLQEVDASFVGNVDASGLYIGSPEPDAVLTAALNAQGFKMVELNPVRPGLSGVYSGAGNIFSSGKANASCSGGLMRPSGTAFLTAETGVSASQASMPLTVV
jgi:hypothetical protein